MSSDANSPKPAWPPGQQHGDEYAMAAEAVQPSAAPTAGGSAGGPQRPSWWYVPRATGKREGPVTLDVLKLRFASGGLSPEDLVWREGMAEWLAAKAVPELGAPRASQGAPPPFPSAPAAPAKPAPSGPSAAELLQQAQGFLGKAASYRIIGLGAGGLCLLWLAISFLVFIWSMVSGKGSAQNWFVGALVFALLFVVGSGIAAILDRLDSE